MMRPAPARWFEVLCARDDVSLLLEALGKTAAVELEATDGIGMPAEWAALSPGLAEFHGWQARCGEFWPPASVASTCPDTPQRTLQRALAAVQSWGRSCEADIAALQQLARERRELTLWLAAIQAWQAQARQTPVLTEGASALIGSWLVEPGAATLTLDEYGLARELELADGRKLWLLLADHGRISTLKAALAAAHGTLLPCPRWLPQPLVGVDAVGAAQQAALDTRSLQHRSHLQAVAAQTGLAQALADLMRLDWIAQCVHALRTSALLAFISGWTSDASGAAIEGAVASSGARALLHFPTPPAQATPPLLLSNPRWARPFEIFSRAFGVPGRNEADPTPVVALVAPLLFGYMFGDIGQGALIVAAGFWLQRRYPLARLAVSAGLASMLFGWVYGSVFAMEHLIQPLWLRPLQQPLAVLAAPLAGGAMLLLLGLALNGLGAWWSGKLSEWLRRDAGGIVVYLGLLLSLFDHAGLWLAGGGVAWTLIAECWHQSLRRRSAAPARGWPELAKSVIAPAAAGTAASAQNAGYSPNDHRAAADLVDASTQPTRARLETSTPAIALAAALGELLERSLQLAVNTLSFARVGAFALAHAGLSSAVIALAQIAGHGLGGLLVLILGNLVILVLEAMVVSIQTTRLVLFEFFTRFLTGAGRVFAPLPPPPSMTGRS